MQNNNDQQESQTQFYVTAKVAVEKAVEDMEKQVMGEKLSEKDCLNIGIDDLNLCKGNLIVVSGSASSGKTAFALGLLNILAVEQGIPAGYISCGAMEYGIFGQRIIAMNSGVSYSKMRRGMLTVDDIRNIQNGANRMYESPLFLYERPNILFPELEFTARVMVEDQNIQLLVIDGFEYLQEVVDADEEEYRLVLDELMDQFKKMARELNIPVILVMDMPEAEEGILPSVKGFRKYMVIPHTADMVLILKKGRYHDDDRKSPCCLTIAKNEHGPCWTKTLLFDEVTAGFAFLHDSEE